MQKHANLWIQMDHILSVWYPNSMQTSIRLSRKSCVWIRNSVKNGLTPWTRNFKTCSNQEPLNLSVGTKYSNRARNVPTTWAFCKKCHPSGEVYCFTAHMCMRGDLQCENYLNNETFAPVMEWATIRMLFSPSIIEGWSAASVGFKNAFAQATLPKPIYLELLPGYVQANPGAKDKVTKIKKSSYGDCHAATLWYRMLCKSLIKEMGFTLSEMDSCPFVKNNCIVVLYVDDAIIFSKDMQKLNVCCNSSTTSTTTFCVTRCSCHIWASSSRICPTDASNCHSCTSNHPQLTSWVLVMLPVFNTNCVSTVQTCGLSAIQPKLQLSINFGHSTVHREQHSPRVCLRN